MSIGKKLKHFTLNDFVNENGENPFHDLFDDFDDKYYHKYLVIEELVEHLGFGCMEWFNQNNTQGISPRELLIQQANPDSLLGFILTPVTFLKESDTADEKKLIHTEILKKLASLFLNNPEKVMDAILNNLQDSK